MFDLSKKAQAFLQELRFAVLATINQDGAPSTYHNVVSMRR